MPLSAIDLAFVLRVCYVRILHFTGMWYPHSSDRLQVAFLIK